MKGEWFEYPCMRCEDVVMDFLRPFVAASVVTLTLVGAGHAADLTILAPQNSLIVQPRPVADYAPRNILMSGWYLRGDCGYNCWIVLQLFIK